MVFFFNCMCVFLKSLSTLFIEAAASLSSTQSLSFLSSFVRQLAPGIPYLDLGVLASQVGFYTYLTFSWVWGI